MMASKLLRAKTLVDAIHEENINLISSLLQDGAPPNLVLPVEGVSPFHLVVGSESKHALEFTTLFLEFNGNPNVRSTEGLTPVHVAASWGRFQALDILLRNGGDPGLTDEEGQTPRDMAVANNHWDCTRLLEAWVHEEDGEGEGGHEDLAVKLEESQESVDHQPRDVALDVLGEQRYTSEQEHLQQKEVAHSPLFQSPQHSNLVVDRMVKGGSSWSPCSCPDTCSSSSSAGSDSPCGSSRYVTDRNAVRDASWSPSSASCCSTFSTAGSEVSLGSPTQVVAIESYLYDNGDAEISFPKRPSVPSSLSSNSRHSSYEDTMNKAMRSLGLENLSMSSLPSILYYPSDSSISPSEKPDVNSERYNNNSISTSSGVEQNDCSFSQSHIELENPSDHQKSSEPNCNSQSDPNITENSSLDQVSLGMGLDVTSPDHAVVFSKGKIKDRRQTMACHLIYPSPNYFEEHFSDDGGDDDDDDDGDGDGDDDDVRADSEPRDHFLCGEVTEITTKEAKVIADSSLSDSCEQSSGELSSYHTAVSEGPLMDTSTQRRSVYRSRKSCLELVEDHLPSASSGSDPSLLNFSLISADDTVMYDWTSFWSDSVEDEDHQAPPIPPELLRLSNEDIMSRLKDLGEGAGPVTSSTRSVYLNLLVRLLHDSNSSKRRAKSKQDSCNINFQYELAEVLNGTKPLPSAHDLESEMVALFQQPDRHRKWREGVLKSSFNYLLLDPRVTRDLPRRYPKLTQLETFRTFVSAIFYVGKGKRSRPYAHFEEAVNHAKKKKKPSAKVLHILDIWSGGMGVVSLHCFQNVIPVEAYTREACMIDAVGMSRLTNAKRGDYYGVAHSWCGAKKRLVGVHLLHKACQIFLMEGERQIRSSDIVSGQ